MRVVALACLVLAGCASRPQPVVGHFVSPEEAQTISAAELCLGRSTWGPRSARSAADEIERRGINCADHAAGIQQLQADRAAALGILLSRQPQPVPIYQAPLPGSSTRQCRTWWDGAAYRTACQ